jgi:RNA polymerase sigma-70 factor (ECF subfamily)
MTPAAHTSPLDDSAIDDDALVAGLRSGDTAAFEPVYARYHAGIYNVCARILGDREEAQDLTQDVFVTAFRRLPSTEGDLRLRPWLYRVATNACLNHLRSRRHDSSEGSAALEALPAGVDEFERSQTVALVESTLAGLSDRYRTALVLKDLHGLPPDEIAAVMDVSRGNADVLVHRARASFRRTFARLAGDGKPAPASLAAVLAPLAVPAVLHAMPALVAAQTGVATVSAAAHAAGATSAVAAGSHAAATGSAAAHAAGHAGGGLLSKLSAGLTAKVAIAAATATVVVGGGVALDKLVTAPPAHRAQPPSGTAATAGRGVPAAGAPMSTALVSLRGAGCDGWTRWAGHGWAHDGYSYRCSDHGGSAWASAATWSSHDAGETTGHGAGHATGAGTSGGSDSHSADHSSTSADHSSTSADHSTSSSDHSSSGSGDAHPLSSDSH